MGISRILWAGGALLVFSSLLFSQGSGARWHHNVYLEMTQSRNENLETEIQLADLNGDGFPEIMFSDPYFDGPAFSTNVGRVMVFDGRSGQVLWEKVGSVYEGRFGFKVSFLQDLTGDGISDIGVCDASSTRSLFLFSGSSFALWNNPQVDSNCFDVISASDLTGDGIPEIAVVRSQSSLGRAVQLLDGVTLAVVQEAAIANGPASLTELGDLNGDGHPEIGVTERFTIPGLDTSFVLDGSSLLDLPIFNAVLLSVSVLANGGDIDGDGTPDILGGDPLATHSGVIHAGEILVISGIDGSILNRYQGRMNDSIGSLLGGIGDVDYDGNGDFLIGSNLAGSPAGSEVRLISGVDFSQIQSTRIPRHANGLDKSVGVLPATLTSGLVIAFSDPDHELTGPTTNRISAFRFGN